MRRLALILIATATLFIGACDLGDSKQCPEGTDRWVEYQLFMGRSGPDGDNVDDAEWDTFLADAVTPRFPDGLTVLDANGQWRGSDGMVQKESSKVLIIFVPKDDEIAGRPNQGSF